MELELLNDSMPVAVGLLLAGVLLLVSGLMSSPIPLALVM